MRIAQKIFSILLLTGTLLVVGCVKFDDPPISAELIDNYDAPCHDELTDNHVTIMSGISELDPMTFTSVVVEDGEITCQPTYGFVKIVLDEPFESGVYALNYPFREPGEGLIKIRLYDFLSSPVYYSQSGTIYVAVQPDGSTIIEWCDVTCHRNASGNQHIVISGRAIVE